jgi:CzcA family heavy metal efflux pump
LRDVARVVEDAEPKISEAAIGGQRGVIVLVDSQFGSNTLAVTAAVEAALEEIKPALEGQYIQLHPALFRPANFIHTSVRNVSFSLLLGGLLVCGVLFGFLLNVRTAFISLTAIPLSLLAAVIVLDRLGLSLNTLTLGGLAIAIGEVVDDAIIDVENIVRRLRLERGAAQPRPAYQVVFDASLEVRSAIVFASLIVMLVFLPVFLLEGLAGSFFRPLAWAYVLAIFASMLVALTVTPALCLMLLPGRVDQRHESPLVRKLKGFYGRVLPGFITRPKGVVIGLIVALVATLATVPFLGEEFLPKFQETDFLMHWVEKPGMSIEAMDRITVRVSRELRAIPGVRNFGSHIGRAEVADEVVGPNFTELWISLDPAVDYPSTVAKIQAVVDGYPGLYRDLLTYLRERIKEVLTGTSASVVVRIYGSDMATLRDIAQQAEQVMAQVPGAINLKVEPQVLVPQVEVRLRGAEAASFGLTPGHVRRAATTLVKGAKVGEVYHEQQVFDVTVWGQPALRTDLGALHQLPMETPGGAQVPLGEVARVQIAAAPNEIKREGASRRIDVTCNIAGRDLGSVAHEIEAKVRQLSFPRGYHPEFLGEYAAQAAAKNRIFGLGLLALAGIVVLLYTDFRSVRLVLLVLLSSPLALIGGVAGAWLGGGALSLGSLVGFVTVLGISVRNGIMLVSHYRHLQQEEGMAFGTDLVLRGAQERLAPILMTALTTALGLVPLILGGNRPGHEIEYPMAWVIVGGLASSTLLNLLLVPALYRAFAVRQG